MGSKLYPVNFEEKNSHLVRGTFEGRQVNLTEDFNIHYELDPAASDTLHVLTHRNPVSGAPSPDEVAPVSSTNEPGFFEALALPGTGKSDQPPQGQQGASASSPHTLVILFDTSLSMQWEKLDRSYEALEKLLHSLTPADRFNLILFNTETSPFQHAPIAADPATVQKALDFVRASRLRGGTDLQAALDAGLSQCPTTSGGNAHLVLLSDGGATRGMVQNGKLAEWYAARWKQLPEAQRPRTYIFGVGDDANLPLLRLLARSDGVLESVLSTEPLDFKLDAFLDKIGRSPIAQLRLEVTAPGSVDLVYPLQDTTFGGSVAAWVGQYKKPENKVAFAVHGVRDSGAFDLRKTANLPAVSADHPQIPRLWARARVDALLEKIEREGEDPATIDEIIRLARKYKFVTPYTSFLAVPRALLRPRVIRPGDPVLRVKTDASIVSVVALFPFGLTKPLRHLAAEDVWQTRFLAPDDMQDGAYQVRLILRDRAGRTYRESKSFVIASTPPVIRIALDRKSFHRGETIALKVSASKSTRTLVARLEGAAPVSLRWNQKAAANTGELIIPGEIPAGTYHLRVIGEDIAHNTGTQEVAIEILP